MSSEYIVLSSEVEHCERVVLNNEVVTPNLLFVMGTMRGTMEGYHGAVHGPCVLALLGLWATGDIALT